MAGETRQITPYLPSSKVVIFGNSPKIPTPGLIPPCIMSTTYISPIKSVSCQTPDVGKKRQRVLVNGSADAKWGRWPIRHYENSQKCLKAYRSVTSLRKWSQGGISFNCVTEISIMSQDRLKFGRSSPNTNARRTVYYHVKLRPEM